jgi:hypothetical protein
MDRARGTVHLEGRSLPLADLPSEVTRTRRSLVLRAVPRIVGFGVLFDGYITGGGSYYVAPAERAAKLAGLTVPPRLTLPTPAISYSAGDDDPLAVDRCGGRLGMVDLFAILGTRQVSAAVAERIRSESIVSSTPLLTLVGGADVG